MIFFQLLFYLWLMVLMIYMYKNLLSPCFVLLQSVWGACFVLEFYFIVYRSLCVSVCVCFPTSVPYPLLKSCSDDACSFVLVCHCVRYIMHISPSTKLDSCIRLYLSAAEVTLPSYFIPLVRL